MYYINFALYQFLILYIYSLVKQKHINKINTQMYNLVLLKTFSDNKSNLLYSVCLQTNLGNPFQAELKLSEVSSMCDRQLHHIPWFHGLTLSGWMYQTRSRSKRKETLTQSVVLFTFSVLAQGFIRALESL